MEAQRRDEEYKKAMAKGMTHEEFEEYYKGIAEKEKASENTDKPMGGEGQ